MYEGNYKIVSLYYLWEDGGQQTCTCYLKKSLTPRFHNCWRERSCFLAFPHSIWGYSYTPDKLYQISKKLLSPKACVFLYVSKIQSHPMKILAWYEYVEKNQGRGNQKGGKILKMKGWKQLFKSNLGVEKTDNRDICRQTSIDFLKFACGSKQYYLFGHILRIS